MSEILSLWRSAYLFVLVVPIITFYFGAALNQSVLAANGGKFPVMINARDSVTEGWKPDDNGLIDDTHCTMTALTRLNWLGDYIRLRRRGLFGTQLSILSPGDVFIGVGSLLWSYAPAVWFTLILSDLARGTRRASAYAGAEGKARRFTLRHLIAGDALGVPSGESRTPAPNLVN